MYGQSPYYPAPVMQNAQQRLQMLEAQYPQFANPSPMGYTQQNGYTGTTAQGPSQPLIIKGRPVSNEEEANAAMIDFDGSLFIFPDKAHGKIYTKQLGLDGNIIFNRYTLDSAKQPPHKPEPQAQDSLFVKQEDLNRELADIKLKLSHLEEQVQGINHQEVKPDESF